MLFLSRVPDGFQYDEAFNGYDAYSILTTGHDQYGQFLPAFVRSAGDFRESCYAFLTIPFIKILGLNEFAVRFPAALVGSLTIIVLYLLAKEFFDRKIALAAAFFLAISPWHIKFSRIAARSVFLPFLFCLGLFFFIKSSKKPRYLLLSALTFSLSLWTYFSARVFVPLFIFGAGIIFFKNLWKMKRELVLSAVIFLCFFVPLFFFWITPAGMARARDALIISLPQDIYYYLSYFDPLFLFSASDLNPIFNIPNTGLVHLFEVVTVLAGIVAVFLNVKEKKYQLLLLWLFLYPIPAALSGPQHSIRSIVGSPLFSILSALGIFAIFSLFKYRKGKVVFALAVIFTAVISIASFSRHYFIDYAKYTARGWIYGVREAIAYAEDNKNSYDSVIVTDYLVPANRVDGARILTLFYTRYPPSLYQSDLRQGLRDSAGKYHILPISKELKAEAGYLYIIRPQELDKLPGEPYNWRICHIIRDPYDNKERILLVEHK